MSGFGGKANVVARGCYVAFIPEADSPGSPPDLVREQRVTPLVQGPHEVRLGVDCPTFAIAPFSSVGVERKVPHLVIASLFPMVDRQRLAIVLAIETGLHALKAAWLSPHEGDVHPVSPQHQDVSPLRPEETTKPQELAIVLIGLMILESHVGVEQLNPQAVAIAGMDSFQAYAQTAGDALTRVKAKHPVEPKLLARRLQQQSAVPAFGNTACLDVR